MDPLLTVLNCFQVHLAYDAVGMATVSTVECRDRPGGDLRVRSYEPSSAKTVLSGNNRR